MQETRWDIRHEGRTWNGQEAQKRYELLPEKIEMLPRPLTRGITVF